MSCSSGIAPAGTDTSCLNWALTRAHASSACWLSMMRSSRTTGFFGSSLACTGVLSGTGGAGASSSFGCDFLTGTLGRGLSRPNCLTNRLWMASPSLSSCSYRDESAGAGPVRDASSWRRRMYSRAIRARCCRAGFFDTISVFRAVRAGSPSCRSASLAPVRTPEYSTSSARMSAGMAGLPIRTSSFHCSPAMRCSALARSFGGTHPSRLSAHAASIRTRWWGSLSALASAGFARSSPISPRASAACMRRSISGSVIAPMSAGMARPSRILPSVRAASHRSRALLLQRALRRIGTAAPWSFASSFQSSRR